MFFFFQSPFMMSLESSQIVTNRLLTRKPNIFHPQQSIPDELSPDSNRSGFDPTWQFSQQFFFNHWAPPVSLPPSLSCPLPSLSLSSLPSPPSLSITERGAEDNGWRGWEQRQLGVAEGEPRIAVGGDGGGGSSGRRRRSRG